MPSPHSPLLGPIVFVVLGFAALGFLVLEAPQGATRLLPAPGGYPVTAKFDNVGDLRVGSPLTVSGVRIGAVEQIRYDATAAKAVITMRVNWPRLRLPVDSIASVRSLSPVGGKQVVIAPGGSDDYLAAGGELLQTTSGLGLEGLIEKSMSAAAAHVKSH